MHPVKRTQLSLETLTDRIVPATVNLTSLGSSGVLNGAIFSHLAPGANGSDPTDTFLTLQERTLLGALLTPEEGYNTNARPHQYDATGGADETRALQLSEAPIITVGEVDYREFLLTIRAPSFTPNVTLDELRIFVGETPDVRGYNNTTNSLQGLPVAYNLDAGGNNTVRVNDNLNRSGSADVAVLIPQSAFTAAGADSDSFVYLYSSFGAAPLTSVLSGAEAWSVRELPDPPPPPAGGLTLSGSVLRVTQNWLPGSTDETELLGPLVGVRIELLDGNGMNVLDQDEEPVFVLTQPDGSFTFTGLAAGTYGLRQVFDENDAGLASATNFVGNSGGNSIEGDNDEFDDIMLVEGVNGVDYIFTERNDENA